MKRPITTLTVPLALALFVTACGGDDDGSTDGTGESEGGSDGTGSTDGGDGEGDSDGPGSTGGGDGGATAGDPTSGGDPSTGGDSSTGGATSGGETGDPTATGGGGTGFASDVYPIIAANCSCHVEGAPNDLAMPDAQTAYGNLVDVMSPRVEKVRVVPGDSASSYIIEKLTTDPPQAGERMPRGRDPLSDADIATIAAWIDDGANP